MTMAILSYTYLVTAIHVFVCPEGWILFEDIKRMIMKRVYGPFLNWHGDNEHTKPKQILGVTFPQPRNFNQIKNDKLIDIAPSSDDADDVDALISQIWTFVAAPYGRCEHATERTPSPQVTRASNNRDSPLGQIRSTVTSL